LKTSEFVSHGLGPNDSIDPGREVRQVAPALRAITVRDLLTHRMGFGSVMAMPDTYPSDEQAGFL